MSDLDERIRSIADMLIENGMPLGKVRMHVQIQTGVRIGLGDAGPDPSLPPCPYCEASDGGMHGRGCPGPAPGTRR